MPLLRIGSYVVDMNSVCAMNGTALDWQRGGAIVANGAQFLRLNRSKEKAIMVTKPWTAAEAKPAATR